MTDRMAEPAKRVAPIRPWRFWPKVDKRGRVPVKRPGLGPCWLWLGRHSRKGYSLYAGTFAHRAAYRLAKGEIPEGTEIDHLCENRGCVNPGHLEAVPHWVNVARARKDRCRNGHPYTPGSFYVRKNGRRVCKTCFKASQRRWHNTTDVRKGHAVTRCATGGWWCKCGISLGSTQKSAREAMRPHRRELWEASDRPSPLNPDYDPAWAV